jgi:hypothetical protein
VRERASGRERAVPVLLVVLVILVFVGLALGLGLLFAKYMR